LLLVVLFPLSLPMCIIRHYPHAPLAPILGADFGYGPKPELSETQTPKFQNSMSYETPVCP
jgi:hypothetical protein